MNDHTLFFGRRDELRQWEQVLASREGQAVLVVGQQGMGKTMLVDKMRELAAHHPQWTGGAVRYEIVPTDPPETTMSLMLDHTLEAAQVEAGSFDGTPQRRSQWKALIKAIVPKGGDLVELVNSLRHDPERHVRDQFIERLELISRRMPKNGRAVFILDPEKYMPEGSHDTWRLVVRHLPEKVKLVFAQRNDGRLMASSDFLALSNVTRIPDGDLDVLDEQAVEQLVEVFSPRIDHLSKDVRRAIAVYERHPYAVPAALELLADGAAIEALPSDPTPERIAAAQWKHVCSRGQEAIRLFRAYAVLEVAVPDDVLLAIAEIDSASHQSLVADDYVAGLLRDEADGRRIYHSLLGDHVFGTLTDDDALSLHGRAVQVFRQRLKASAKPDPLAATRLAEHVLAAEGKTEFVESFLNECTPALVNLGLLATCTLMSDRALAMVDSGTSQEAALLGNLGVIYGKTGDLDQAEQMFRKSLEFDEKLGRLEGMAGGYGNLGVIYQTRGDLDRAEQMHRKSLEINEKLSNLEGMAIDYGNLGLIYRTRGDLDQAEQMHRKSLEINEKLGRLEGMASEYANFGLICRTRGDLDRAEEMLRKSLEINETLGHLEGIANQYGNLGVIYQERGDLDRAEQMHRKSLEIEEKLGDLEGMASNYGNLGLIYRKRGDMDRAEQMHRKSLEIEEKLGRLEGIASEYANLGLIAEERGDIALARKLWTQSRDLFKRVGAAHRVEQVQGWLDGLCTEGEA